VHAEQLEVFTRPEKADRSVVSNWNFTWICGSPFDELFDEPLQRTVVSTCAKDSRKNMLV